MVSDVNIYSTECLGPTSGLQDEPGRPVYAVFDRKKGLDAGLACSAGCQGAQLIFSSQSFGGHVISGSEALSGSTALDQ